MRTVLSTATLSLFVVAAPALAQTYTPAQQRAACRGDAIRLCWRFIPNRAAIANCMASKHDRLSPKCMKVFDAGMQEMGR